MHIFYNCVIWGGESSKYFRYFKLELPKINVHIIYLLPFYCEIMTKSLVNTAICRQILFCYCEGKGFGLGHDISVNQPETVIRYFDSMSTTNHLTNHVIHLHKGTCKQLLWYSFQYIFMQKYFKSATKLSLFVGRGGENRDHSEYTWFVVVSSVIVCSISIWFSVSNLICSSSSLILASLVTSVRSFSCTLLFKSIICWEFWERR